MMTLHFLVSATAFYLRFGSDSAALLMYLTLAIPLHLPPSTVLRFLFVSSSQILITSNPISFDILITRFVQKLV